MSTSSLGLDERLNDYLRAVSLREPPLLKKLRDETANLPEKSMQIAPEQGQFMGLLIELTGAKRAVEIGTFTGYSALCMAAAMPEDGSMTCCDVSEEWTSIARRYWAEAGLDHKIDLRLGPAKDTLDSMISGGEAGSFDIAFIDADKENYDGYYERCLELVRPGGLIIIDNVLWNGAVADPERDDADTNAIRALNEKLRDDERVALSMVPIADGLTLCVKR